MLKFELGKLYITVRGNDYFPADGIYPTMQTINAGVIPMPPSYKASGVEILENLTQLLIHLNVIGPNMRWICTDDLSEKELFLFKMSGKLPERFI